MMIYIYIYYVLSSVFGMRVPFKPTYHPLLPSMVGLASLRFTNSDVLAEDPRRRSNARRNGAPGLAMAPAGLLW